MLTETYMHCILCLIKLLKDMLTSIPLPDEPGNKNVMSHCKFLFLYTRMEIVITW